MAAGGAVPVGRYGRKREEDAGNVLSGRVSRRYTPVPLSGAGWKRSEQRYAAIRNFQLSVSEAQSSVPRGDAIHTALAERPNSLAALHMLKRALVPSRSR